MIVSFKKKELDVLLNVIVNGNTNKVNFIEMNDLLVVAFKLENAKKGAKK